MKLLIPIVAALSLASLWRETNSHAAARRGEAAFAKQDYAAATDAYRRAQQSAPSPRSAFNHGTAQIAAGDRAKGSATLEPAIRDAALRADALYNRGNSALVAKAYDHAVRDFSDALRANPSHAAAKRNLEIALLRQAAQQQQPSGAGGQQQRQQNQQQKQEQPQPKPAPKEGEADAEALLRSVEQQEQEEMRRMKGRAAAGRVGW